MSTTIVTLLWVFGAVIVTGLSAWVLWSLRGLVRDEMKPVVAAQNETNDKLTAIAGQFKVNEVEHAEFGRRLNDLEDERKRAYR